MSDIIKRFSEEAKRVINASLSSARELGHTYVGSEHLLLGILLDEDSTPKKLLIERGCCYKEIRSRVIGLVGMGCKSNITTEDMTPVCKKILLRASIIAKTTSSRVGVEHLLMAILREECVALRLIQNCVSDCDELSAILNELYGDGAAEPQLYQSPKPHVATPMLDKYAEDLTKKAKNGKIDPVIGRAREESRLVSILLRRSKNNPCLIGEAGVGKTAIAESLALRIAGNNVPDELKGKRIMSLELSTVVSGTKYRGEFEEKIKGIIDDVRSSDDVILFIDELHTIVGAGAAEGAIDASNILKPALARGEIRLIGATTPAEYKKYIESDRALERRFQPVRVCEPSEEECVQMLYGLKNRYESFHGVTISDSAIRTAVTLSMRYINDRFLPDKAIDLLDEAASLKRISVPDGGVLDEDDIARAAEERTGIPLAKLTESFATRLRGLETDVGRRIIGQPEAISALCPAIRRAFSGVRSACRPRGTFLFAGSTGVGKTECAKVISELIFGTAGAFIRLDMSEYSEPHSISKLIGSPPGYKGCEGNGSLAEKVRKNPYSLLLFDDADKAHPDVLALLLSVLDDGRLTDSMGNAVSFANTVIILTVCTKKGGTGIGFGNKVSDIRTDDDLPLSRELTERIDEIIYFADLGTDSLKKIAISTLEEFSERVSELGVSVAFDDSFVSAVLKDCNGKSARSIVRYALGRAEDAVSDDLMSGELEKGSESRVFFENGRYFAKITQKTY